MEETTTTTDSRLATHTAAFTAELRNRHKLSKLSVAAFARQMGISDRTLRMLFEGKRLTPRVYIRITRMYPELFSNEMHSLLVARNHEQMSIIRRNAQASRHARAAALWKDTAPKATPPVIGEQVEQKLSNDVATRTLLLLLRDSSLQAPIIRAMLRQGVDNGVIVSLLLRAVGEV